MQKLMKNWVFTMIACILLAIWSVLLFLDGFDVGGMRVADRMLHLFAAVALVIYTVFALFPLVGRYNGLLRGVVLGEIAILLVMALLQICMEWVVVPVAFLARPCVLLGLVLWLRATVEILHAYLCAANKESGTGVPLWKLLFYVLLSALGVWQMAKPLISDKSFVFAIGTVAGVMGVLFAAMTVFNYRVTAPERSAKKQKKQAEAASGELLAAEAGSAALAESNAENKPKED